MRKLLVGFLFLGLLGAVEIKIDNHDLNCSYIITKDKPLGKIFSSMDEDFKKQTFADGDIIFAKGNLNIGESYTIIGREASLSHGYKVYRLQGYGKVIRKEGKVFLIRVEKSCTGVRLGSFLYPLISERGFTLNLEPINEGTVAPPGPAGHVLFIESSLKQLGEGWAIVDGAKKLGLKRADIVMIFQKLGDVRKPVSLGVVLRTAGDYAVIQTLLPISAVRKGYLVYKK